MDIHIEQVDRQVDEYGSSSLKLLIHGKNVANPLMNSLRHVCINQIPIYAFHPDKINIFKNTSVYDNSYMKGRLSQIPINNIKHDIKFLSLLYYKNVNFADPKIEKHEKDTFDIDYYVKVKNSGSTSKGQEKIVYVSTNDLRITINNEVIENSKMYSTEYPILLIKLRPGEEFECSMKAVLAVGELHAIFNASTVYYDEIDENKYNFTIKSYGQMSEYELLILGCDIIIEKYNIIKENIINNEYKLITTEDNSLILEMLNEDYTCGGPLNYILQGLDEVIFSGITKPDFLQKCMLIKLKVDKKYKLLDILVNTIDVCISQFEKIKNELEYLLSGKSITNKDKKKVKK
jgi:DNA-directed RNA polymerase subunit L